MKKYLARLYWLAAAAWLVLLTACQPAPTPVPAANSPRVLAVESFLADIAQNIAGGRLQVDSLLPLGVDPHAFEPTPKDAAKIYDSQALIANGAGLEEWLADLLANANTSVQLIEAAQGLTPRRAQSGETPGHAAVDPHYWLDPLKVVKYVENIRQGFIQADPAGASQYQQNARAYIEQLQALDAWIETQTAQIPAERRLLVTNHENLGYFADRYGFQVVGAVIPSVSSGASPSAQELARLLQRVQETHAPAIFIETGANPELAGQIAQDAGIRVVSDLYTHSLSPAGGPAATYLEMMRYNVKIIVAALK